MKNFKLLIHKVYFGGLILAPIVLLILPADFFDYGEKSYCLSVIILGQTCPACGMTRAFQHLLHFDFSGAAEFNKLIFIVFPLMILFWFLEIRKTLRFLKQKEDHSKEDKL